MSAIEQFENYVKEQKKQGLQDMHIFWNPDLQPTIEDILSNKVPRTVTYESFCEEFMRMINAPDQHDEEVLGSYSPQRNL